MWGFWWLSAQIKMERWYLEAVKHQKRPYCHWGVAEWDRTQQRITQSKSGIMTGKWGRAFSTGTNYNLKFLLLPDLMWSNAAGHDFAIFRAHLCAWEGADECCCGHRGWRWFFTQISWGSHCYLKHSSIISEMTFKGLQWTTLFLKNGNLNYQQLHWFAFFPKTKQVYLFIYLEFHYIFSLFFLHTQLLFIAFPL